MIAYSAKAKENLVAFSSFGILQIPRESNTKANALTHLASKIDKDGLWIVPINI